MLRFSSIRASPQPLTTSLAKANGPFRPYSIAFQPPEPDNVQVPVGASGSISLDIYHPPRPTNAAPVIINFPRGPIASTAPAAPTNLFPLAIAANLTVVQIHYRLSKTHRYPIPIHDALTGYEWVLKHLVSSPKDKPRLTQPQDQDHKRVGVCGELIGGSIAAAVALTECHTRGPSVRAAVLGNPVTDWTAMHPVLPDGSRPLSSAPAPPKPRKRASRVKTAQTSWEVNAKDVLLPATELLRARTALFRSAGDYFDPFASPLLFFRTPSTEIPGDVDPLDEIFAELDGVVRPVDRKRKSVRKYPPLGSGLGMPFTRVWVGERCVLRDQAVELGRAVEKAAGQGRVSVEGMKGTGLWGAEELMEMGRWFGYILRQP